MDKPKLIVTDCDGVLCNWEWAFEVWMEEHGHTVIPEYSKAYEMDLKYGISKKESMQLIRLFNESAAIGFLPALRDAAYYVKLLHEKHGYVFDVVTSLSTNTYAQHLRKKNLFKLFGETAFRNFVFLPTGAGKHNALQPYKNTGVWWLEDKIENAVCGTELGMRSLLVAHGHNFSFEHPEIQMVKDWEEIYDIVLSAE